MARRDDARIQRMDEDGRAMCRRVVMFAPTEAQIGCAISAMQSELDACYEAELAVQDAYLAAQ